MLYTHPSLANQLIPVYLETVAGISIKLKAVTYVRFKVRVRHVLESQHGHSRCRAANHTHTWMADSFRQMSRIAVVLPEPGTPRTRMDGTRCGLPAIPRFPLEAGMVARGTPGTVTSPPYDVLPMVCWGQTTWTDTWLKVLQYEKSNRVLSISSR